MPGDKLAALTGKAYAHRGLHRPGIPENSPSAFRAAIAAGLGIECDIRKSSDGRAIVFHDAALDRLTGRPGNLADLPVSELSALRLKGGEDTIPTLRDLLQLVDGQVPLLLEIKSDDIRSVTPLCRAVRRDLDGYVGPVGVMSFDPRVPQWFARNEGEWPRGLVVTERDERTLAGAIKRRLSVARSRPDFVALDIRDLPSRFARKQAAADRPIFTWTVLNAAHVQTARELDAVPILEGAGVAAWGQAS